MLTSAVSGGLRPGAARPLLCRVCAPNRGDRQPDPPGDARSLFPDGVDPVGDLPGADDRRHFPDPLRVAPASRARRIDVVSDPQNLPRNSPARPPVVTALMVIAGIILL